MEGPKRRRDEFVSASELARLGYCERQVAFDARHGAASTAQQERDRARGREAHARFYSDAVRVMEASRRKGACFVATLALGPGQQTSDLRAWRDLCLRPHRLGRWAIGFYYRVSPAMCRWLAVRHAAPVLALVRAALRVLAKWAAARVHRRLRRELGE